MDNKITLFVVILITLGVVFIFLFNSGEIDYGKESVEEFYSQEVSIEEDSIYTQRQSTLVLEGFNDDQKMEEENVIEEKEKVEYDESMEGFISCLINEGMVVYALSTCPACSSFANQFGGYDEVENLFVECSKEREVCRSKMKTGLVPEIQINDKLYEGSRSLEALSKETNCKLNI